MRKLNEQWIEVIDGQEHMEAPNSKQLMLGTGGYNAVTNMANNYCDSPFLELSST